MATLWRGIGGAGRAARGRGRVWNKNSFSLVNLLVQPTGKNLADELAKDLFLDATASGSATANGAIVTEVYSLVAGTATGEVSATATGATVTEVYSFIGGTASAGAIDATATGATVTEVYSLIAGTATGQQNATASGSVSTEVYSLLAGTATGQTNATASGALVSEVYSFLGGTASSGPLDATANGATFEEIYSFFGGAANSDSQLNNNNRGDGIFRRFIDWDDDELEKVLKTPPKKKERKKVAVQIKAALAPLEIKAAQFNVDTAPLMAAVERYEQERLSHAVLIMEINVMAAVVARKERHKRIAIAMLMAS